MFEKLFKRPHYVKRHIDAPLLKERAAYLQRYIDDKRTITTVISVAQYLLRIIEFLALKTTTQSCTIFISCDRLFTLLQNTNDYIRRNRKSSILLGNNQRH